MNSKEINADKIVIKSEWDWPTNCGLNPLCSPSAIDVQDQGGAKVSYASEYGNTFGSNHLQQDEVREAREKPTTQAPRATQVNTVIAAPHFSAPFRRLVDLKERIAKNRKGEKLRNRQRIKRAVKTSVSIVKEAFNK